MATIAIPDSEVIPDQAPGASQLAIPDSEVIPDSAQYETPGQQVLAGAEGASRGLLSRPITTAVERMLSGLGVPGLSKQARIGREQANPLLSDVTETGGFLAGALAGEGLPAALGAVGDAAKGALGLGGLAKDASIAQRLSASAAAGAAEMGTLRGTNEIDNYLNNAPQTVGGVVANVGLAILLGGVSSPLITGGGMLAKSVIDNPTLKEFTDRLAFRKSNIDPNEMIKHEADNVVNTYQGMNDEVNGPTGLKAQAMSNLMPEEMTSKIGSQIQDMADKSEKAIANMREKQVPERYITKFQNDANTFMEQVTNPNVTPGQTFDALNAYKKTLQDYSKGNFGPFAIPSYHEAYDFLNITKGLGYEARIALEDPKVWGEVADLQKGLNASWRRALPAFQDFKKKFMTTIGDDSIISSDKFNTYVNQAGKATSTTDKQRMLGNFVDAMSNHFDTVDKLYQAANVENPFPIVGMSSLKESLNQKSVGAKLADMWHDKLSSQSIGGGLGSLAGGAMGSVFGQGLGGMYLGKEVLGPVFSNLIKPLLERYPNLDLDGFKQASALFKNSMKGEKLLNNAVASIFEGSGRAFPTQAMPSPEQLVALDDKAKKLNGQYEDMSNIPGKTGYYLPNHGTAIAKTANDAIQYLNSKRPVGVKALPLDSDPKVSTAQKAAFNKTLSIAQQPLTVMKHINNGTLTSSDITDLKTMYPEYYDSMSKKLMQAVVQQNAAGKRVPYETARMLSLFLGQPLDSSMSPSSIQAAQSVYAPKQPPQAPAQGKPKKSTSKMGKNDKTYQTQSQAAESDRSNRD